MNSVVSVIVVTYNSSQFVEETLESISKQTWKDIELIITDDRSEDNTVEVCLKWINKNSDRFLRTEIIESDINTGVPANANRGLYAAKGDWVAYIAGDDNFKPNHIKDNMDFIASRKEVKVLLSKIEVYQDSFKPENLIKVTPEDAFNPTSIMAPGRSADSQYRMLLRYDRIHYTPSLFINRETLISIGAYDERFRMLEDYPLWLNLTKNGYKLYFMDKVTVRYRRHSRSINKTVYEKLINDSYFNEEEFRKIYTYPNMPVDIKLNERFTWYVLQIFRINWLNRNTKLREFLLVLLSAYLNPFRYYIWIKKKLNKELKNNELYV